MHILEFTETWVYNALQDHFELCRDVNRQVVKKKKKLHHLQFWDLDN